MILTKTALPLPPPGTPSRFPFSDVPPVHAPECKKYIASRFLIENLERGGDRPRGHSQGGHSGDIPISSCTLRSVPPPALTSVPAHRHSVGLLFRHPEEDDRDPRLGSVPEEGQIGAVPFLLRPDTIQDVGHVF